MADQPPTAESIIKQFEALHGRTLGRDNTGGPLWQDGSEAAALLAIRWHVEPLIFNGGWPAVYCSGAGWAVPLAARGYRLLGMPECAERCVRAMNLVAKAEAAHPGDDHRSDTWLASTLMEEIGQEDWDRLDEGWFELTRGTFEALAQYIVERRLHSRTPGG